MARDEFSSLVKERLAERAGQRCSMAHCRRTTVGPSNESPVSVANIGVAAHICAASQGGRRYDREMTPEQRSSIDNGIWLCAIHATLIDRDEVRYTKDTLHAIKREHEAWAHAALNGLPEDPIDDPTAQRVSLVAQRIIQAQPEKWEDLFFAQVLRDEIARYSDKARDLRYGVSMTRQRLDLNSVIDLKGRSLDDAAGYAESVERLFGQAVQDAMGPEGSPADPETIAYVGSRIAAIYGAMLDWAIRWQSTACETPGAEGFLRRIAEYFGAMAATLEVLPREIEERIADAQQSRKPGETVVVTIKLTLAVPDSVLRALEAEVRRLHAL
jgi:hypothetical protein